MQGSGVGRKGPGGNAPVVGADALLENVPVSGGKKLEGKGDAFIKGGGTSTITRDAEADALFVGTALSAFALSQEGVQNSRGALESTLDSGQPIRASDAQRLVGRLGQLAEELSSDALRLASRGAEKLGELSQAMTDLKLEIDASRSTIVFAELAPETKKKSLLLDLEKVDVTLSRALHEVVSERHNHRPQKSSEARDLVRALVSKAMFAEDSGEGHVAPLYDELAQAELKRVGRTGSDPELQGYVDFMLGELHSSFGRWDEAALAYGLAIEHSPEREPPAQLGRARAALALGHRDEALAALERAVSAADIARVPEIKAQIARSPGLQGLRDDPRWAVLLAS